MFAIWVLIGCLTMFDIICYMVLRHFEKKDGEQNEKRN